jgi:hypothetical protein
MAGYGFASNPPELVQEAAARSGAQTEELGEMLLLMRL